MSASIDVKEFKNIFSSIVDLKKEGLSIPVLLHGVHGIGKTEVVGQVAEELNYNFVPLYLSTQDVSDLIGIPYRDENGATRFATPDWLHDALNDSRDCVFFLDEINRAPHYVLQTMLPFTLDGILHTHKIRERDIVVAAANPETADYNITTMDDRALLSRFAHFYFEPTQAEWISYCSQTKVHPAIIDVVNTSPNLIGNIFVDEESRYQSKPDRRNMWKIGKVLNLLDENKISEIGFKLFSSMVGTDIAGLILKAFKDLNNLTIENIFDGSVFNVLNFESDLDKINVLNESLVGFLSDRKLDLRKLRSKKMKDNLKKYLDEIPLDSQYSVLRTLKYKFDGEKLPRLVEILDTIDPDFISRTADSYTEKEEDQEKQGKKK